MMTSNAWAALRRRVMEHEALRLKLYDDATGKGIGPGAQIKGQITIGYGHNLSGKGITEDQAEYLLERDLGDALTDTMVLFGTALLDRLTDARKGVLVEMMFNMGATTFREFKTMRRAVLDGRFEAAADAMLKSRWATQVGRRATRLARIMRTGVAS